MNECIIIMADDDSDDREFFMDALEPGRKVNLIQAQDGVELIETLHNMEQLPTVIFLDLNMPLKDGHQCLMEIRAADKFKEIPVIIYTTSSNSLHIDRTYKSGASLYITKPNEFNKLKEMFEKLFKLNVKQYLPQPSIDKFVFRLD